MPVSLADPVLLFLDELEAGGRTPVTLKNYRSALQSFLRYLKPRALVSATSLDLRDFLASRKSVNTKVLYLISLRRFYRFALTRGFISGDPTEGIPTPKIRRREYIPLSEGEVSALLDACDPTFRILVHILVQTGARVSETCAIRVEDVSLEEDGGTIDFPVRKGGEPGYAAFGPDLAAVLKTYLPTREGWLFERGGKPVSIFVVERRLHQAAKRARISKRVTPHTLRHLFATRAVEAGWSQMALQKQLGHRNPSSTAVYYHPSRKGLREVYKRTFHVPY